MNAESLDFYATPGRFTTLTGDHLILASADVGEVVELVQGLLVYDVVAQPFYGAELSSVQADAIHERDTARLLEIALAVDGRPLREARPAAQRVGARCHAFTRLTVALLRAAGVPARSRCGFGAYFRSGWYEDHWVAEYWHSDESRWRMVDAQLDATWRTMIGFEANPLDLSPAQFLTAGHAWQAWRNGQLDDGRCGLAGIDEHGAHWIAGNLRLDLASLNKVEMLPWDVWGSGWEPGQEPTEAQLQLFDEVAALTVDPDRQLHELRTRYETDANLTMAGTVLNVLRGQVEAV